MPNLLEKSNLNSALVIDLFLIDLDFKLVIVGKGKPFVWTTAFFRFITVTYMTSKHVCCCDRAMLRKMNNFSKRDDPVDK